MGVVVPHPRMIALAEALARPRWRAVATFRHSADEVREIEWLFEELFELHERVEEFVPWNCLAIGEVPSIQIFLNRVLPGEEEITVEQMAFR